MLIRYIPTNPLVLSDILSIIGFSLPKPGKVNSLSEERSLGNPDSKFDFFSVVHKLN